MMDVKPLVVFDNKTKNGIKAAIDILKLEVNNIGDRMRNGSKNENERIRCSEEMLSHILSIEHLKEVLNESNKVNK